MKRGKSELSRGFRRYHSSMTHSLQTLYKVVCSIENDPILLENARVALECRFTNIMSFLSLAMELVGALYILSSINSLSAGRGISSIQILNACAMFIVISVGRTCWIEDVVLVLQSMSRQWNWFVPWRAGASNGVFPQ